VEKRMIVMQEKTRSGPKHAPILKSTLACSLLPSPTNPNTDLKKETSVMLWTILVILLVLWLVGLLSNVGGSLIHLLLVVAVVVLIINLVTGRRAV
jgi:hypothetical protein